MDIYILAADRDRVVQLTEEAGLQDIGDRYPYEHHWTYRATDGNVIIEAIWAMRNGRADVDLEWFEASREIEVRALRIPVTPPEEIIWAKLYVMMRERCDWPDVLNYLYYCGDGLDWRRLFQRLGEDIRLLGGALCVFSWLSPERISNVPEWVWETVGLRVPDGAPRGDSLRRAHFLSPCHWYGPTANGALLEQSR